MTDGSAFRATAYSLLFDRYHWAWCTTNHGLFRYNTRTNRMQAVPYRAFSRTLFGSYWINDMIRLHDGSVLFSTFDGLYQIWREGGRDRIEPFPLLNDRAYRNYDALFQDSRGNLFVRDNGDSLHVLRQTGSGREYQQVHGVVFLDDLLCMEEDIRSDRLYIGTNAGLFILHLQDLTLERPTINDALKLQNISRLLIRDADLWIFEERGLFRLSLADGSFRLFTTEDGLPSNEFNPSSEWTPDGNYLVATQNGLVSFSPFHAAEKIYPPRVQLTHIYVNDLPKDFAPNPQELDRVNLQHDENTFALEFSAIAFQHASGARFAYRLEGFDDQWIDNGTSHSTRYSRIPPGDYTFLLRVRQADGKFSPYVKKLEIHIARAFWQTSGFLALTLLVLGLGIWGLVRTYWRFRLGQHRRRFEREQALQKERTRIATDMHDDLGAGLSRIKFLSETIGMKTKMRQPIEEEVGSIGQYANDMIGKMGEIVWALNEKNDSLSDLLAYMRSYAVDYLLQNGIGCKVKSSADFPAQHVSGEFRRNVFLTVKEALHNIVKHARASEVNIIIETGDRLRISICDNGVGFQASRMRAFSTGLNSMQRRMESIGGSWELHHEGGTCIRISAPLTP
jgi:signal transduction histidine kinase